MRKNCSLEQWPDSEWLVAVGEQSEVNTFRLAEVVRHAKDFTYSEVESEVFRKLLQNFTSSWNPDLGTTIFYSSG